MKSVALVPSLSIVFLLAINSAFAVDCPNNCSELGCCDTSSGICQCWRGRGGPDCSIDNTNTFLETFDAAPSAHGFSADQTTVPGSSGVHVGFRADHAVISNGMLNLTLDSATCPSGCKNKPYAGGEWVSTSSFTTGRFSFRAQAASCTGCYLGLGVANPVDAAVNDEIVLFITGQASTQMQPIIFVGGAMHNLPIFSLGFNAAQGFHNYEIVLTESRIQFFADGQAAGTWNGAMPSTAMHVIVELFAIQPQAPVLPGIALCDYVNVTAVPETCLSSVTGVAATTSGAASTTTGSTTGVATGDASTTSTGALASTTSTSGQQNNQNNLDSASVQMSASVALVVFGVLAAFAVL